MTAVCSLGSPVPTKAVIHYWEFATSNYLPYPGGFAGGSLGVTASPTFCIPGDTSLSTSRSRDTPTCHAGLSPCQEQGYSHRALSPKSPYHQSRHYYYKSYCLQCPLSWGTAILAGHGSSWPPWGPWPSTRSDIIKTR